MAKYPPLPPTEHEVLALDPYLSLFRNNSDAKIYIYLSFTNKLQVA